MKELIYTVGSYYTNLIIPSSFVSWVITSAVVLVLSVVFLSVMAVREKDEKKSKRKKNEAVVSSILLAFSWPMVGLVLPVFVIAGGVFLIIYGAGCLIQYGVEVIFESK